MNGWIKLHRKFVNWEWYKSSETVHLFLHLIMSANHETQKWRGLTIHRGQLVTGRKSLSEQTGLSERCVRTCIKRLKTTSELTTKTTNKYTIITLCNYDTYQSYEDENDQQNDQQMANKRPASDQQTTTNKNVKNDKNDKNYLKENITKKKIEARQQEFMDEVKRFSDKYPESMLRDFYRYWSEKDRGRNPKMRFEKQKTWETPKRLATWYRNAQNINEIQEDKFL